MPPTDYWNGWACFVVSILMIGLLTAFIGDLASHFGCTIGLKDSVTAVVFVALGTSVPGEHNQGFGVRVRLHPGWAWAGGELCSAGSHSSGLRYMWKLVFSLRWAGRIEPGCGFSPMGIIPRAIPLQRL